MKDFVENPVKTYIDDSMFFNIDLSRQKLANFLIQRNSASLEDDYIQLGQSVDLDFYSVNNIRQYDALFAPVEVKDNYLVGMYLRYDKSSDEYTRKIYSLLDFLGDIGGFKETVIIFGQFVIGFVVERLFFAKIMKNIYQTRKYKDDKTFFNSDEYK
jgi:hypothetical protein